MQYYVYYVFIYIKYPNIKDTIFSAFPVGKK